MGVVASVYCTDTSARVVLLKKKRKFFVFQDNLTLRPGEFRFPEVYLSYSYPDLVFETVRIPPVSDEETVEILVKKRLSDTLGLGGSYLTVFEEVPEESTPNEKVLRVFAIPEEVYRKESVLPRGLEENLMIFTTVHFSLHGISKAVAGDMTVLHAFADDESLVMTVSRGDEVLYTRSLKIPPYTKTDDRAFLDFVLENLNMTYMFVARRSNIPVDLILLSGKLYDREALVAELMPSVSCGISTPSIPERFRNVGPMVFLELIPCFGNLLLDDRHDFSPKEVKERRALRLHLSKLLPVLTLLLIVSLTLSGLRLYRVEEKSREVGRLERVLFMNLSEISRDPLLRSGDLSYYVDYLNLLSRSGKENPLRILPEVEEFLKNFRGVEYVISYSKGKAVLSMSLEEGFNSLAELSLYREKLLRELGELKKNGFDYRIESERKDLNKKTLFMKILLEKRL